MAQATDTTQILEEIRNGDQSRMEDLWDIVYPELRDMARGFLKRERPNHPLNPTGLVHEAFLKLVDQKRVSWQGRAHFMAISAQAMRRILVDHARSKLRKKRSGNWKRTLLTDDALLTRQNDEHVIAVHEALEKLESVDALRARIVELRFFSGMTIKEIAEVLDMSTRTVERHLTAIYAWLRRELSEEPEA